MRFGQIDATEAQLTMMLVMVFTSVVGTGYWGTKVSGKAAKKAGLIKSRAIILVTVIN